LGLTGDAVEVEINVEEFANQIIQINKSTEGGGVLLSGTPESAINSALYYEKPVEQGAAIYRSIISNHMFIDGNKRTAVLALEAFAKKMGVKVASESQLFNVATKVATEHLDVAHIVKLISK
jgi:death-on-curing family protein